jgi:CheY-specific phosphatase CheX
MRQALRESVNDVLEKMFFAQTLGESGPWESAGAAAPEICARLTFEGERGGALTTRMTYSAARQVAADFLGADEAAVPDQQVADVVCELANMICGSVLSRVESAGTFRLSAPRIVPSWTTPPAGPDTTNYGVELSNGRLAVNVTAGTRR